MSETNETAAPGGAVAVNETGAELVLDLTDEQADSLTYLVQQLSGRQDPGAQPFGTLEELFEAERAEDDGIWERWPDVVDGEVLIAHVTACEARFEQLVDLYRRENNLGEVALTTAQREHIMRESWFGTVVKGWRGSFFARLKFREAAFRRLMRLRHFRTFVFDRATARDRARTATLESLGNDSRPASAGK